MLNDPNDTFQPHSQERKNDMKKIALPLVAAILVVVSLGMSAQVATADEGRTCLIGREGTEFSSAECANYLITYGWFATSRGLANEYVEAVHNTITVTGENFYLAYNEDESAQYYLPLIAFDPALIGEDCAMPKLWAARWRPPINQRLEPGVYEIHATYALDHPVTDGWQACSQGEPLGRNIYSGNWDDVWYFTILP
jgi:hypothetical protein